jgi:hypothetical protein
MSWFNGGHDLASFGVFDLDLYNQDNSEQRTNRHAVLEDVQKPFQNISKRFKVHINKEEKGEP